MTDRQTIIDLFEKHADWHDDLAWIEVGCAADLIVDLEDAAHPDDAAMATVNDILFNPASEYQLRGEGG